VIEFILTQRGQLPADALARAIVEAHVRAGATVTQELARAVSGGVVRRGSDTSPTGRSRRPHLVDAIVSQTTRRGTGEVATLVGFDKRVAFIARFLEKGTKPHELGRGARGARAAFGGRRAQRARGIFRGRRARSLAFLAGGRLIFRRNARHPGLQPHPILASALEAARPLILQDFEVTTQKAVGNG